MRFLALLNLLLYFMLSLHAAFDGHVQVLCIEKDGHTQIETLDLAELVVDHPGSTELHICCPSSPSDCEDCTDYYLGSGHPDSQGLRYSADPNLQALDRLEQLPVLQPEPYLTAWAPAVPAQHPPLIDPAETLVHIPSTVLLI